MLRADLIIHFADAVLRAEAVQRTEMHGPAVVFGGAEAVGQHLDSGLAQLRS